jgi:hypothetical protein
MKSSVKAPCTGSHHLSPKSAFRNYWQLWYAGLFEQYTTSLTRVFTNKVFKFSSIIFILQFQCIPDFFRLSPTGRSLLRTPLSSDNIFL